MLARIAMERFSLLVGAIGVVTSIAVAALWLTGGVHWQALLTSLIGIAGGGFIVWSVRVIGWYTLRREAMGFGDVTLMAMIGAFLGWQGCLVTFFLAPFAGLLVGVMQWVTKRENEIPYGPFLCLAALLTVVRWSAIWDYISPLCGLGWLLPAVVVVCLALMAALLLLMRFIKSMLASGS